MVVGRVTASGDASAGGEGTWKCWRMGSGNGTQNALPSFLRNSHTSRVLISLPPSPQPRKPVWPSGKALGWYADDASALLSLPKLWFNL